jgi:hypothetical protein
MSAGVPAFLNNKLAAMYTLKLVRWLGVWTTAYAARTIFFERFVRQTIVARRTPPSLTGMLWMFLALQLAVEAGLVLALALLRHTVPVIGGLVDDAFAVTYLADVVGTLTVLTAVSLAASRAMSVRGRFDFANEGTRALRAYNTLLVTLAGTFFLIPFFLVVPVP